MAKFNLKEHIAKNKSTFFGSLNEGQFSWMTQDTGQQIGSEDENTIPVYMFDNTGKYWFEPSYEGYGVFGGKDYYELLDQMNGGKGDRDRGIDLAFDKEETSSPILFPALVTSPSNFNYKNHDFTKEPESDPNQSWYAEPEYDEEDEDDDFYSRDDEDEEELDEGFQGQFYAPEYLEQKYGKEMASKIEAEIDEMDPNAWDRFTGMESAKEVEDYISDIKDMMDLSEGKIEEKYNTYTHKIAEKFAKYMSEKEGRDFTVTMNSVDEYSFDLDLDGEPYEGGSYLLKGGDIINAAVPGNPVYAKINQFLEEGEAAYEYEKGKEAGEKIEKKKMKKSELKAKIKEMVLAEMDGPAVEDSQYDFLKEIEEMLDEAEGLTPLQDYVYQYEIEISGEDKAQDYLDDIKQLVTPQDVYDYYAYNRDWKGSMDSDLDSIFRQVKRKFASSNTADGLTPLQKQAYSYAKERFGFEDAKNSLDQIKTLTTREEFSDWVKKKIEAEKSLSEAEDEEVDAEVTDTEAAADAGAEEVDTTIDVSTDEIDPNVKAVQDALTQAQAAAQQLGDKKLMDQIGNTITFFTRSHVVEKPGAAVSENINESMFPMLKKILK